MIACAPALGYGKKQKLILSVCEIACKSGEVLGAPEGAHGGVNVKMGEERFGARECLETRNRLWRGHAGHVSHAVLF